MPSKQAPRPCRRCRAGVQRRQTASSSRLQGDVPKANQQEIPSFLLPALSFFFSILIVHLFRGFRRLRNTNPNCSSAFVSFHILVLVYCRTNGAQQIIMQKYTRYILSKEKLFTKMCSPRVTCTSSSNHTGIKLIYNIPSVGSPSCIFLWEELSSGLELGFYVPS